ncbi:hypothetical protein MUN84_00360 [Hymenobacter sp. 5516J-16]|uniref:hypothetical protein n=1 Tax=Hymenobacter sp. 5516J-16 TaxID=2932253 RepID=UPI001FD39635|nr:hypothetical protein [Hymenobacter sp. 5516J-16]UOQ77233.1 hypothetical protein MUN84_00360 [Hymenobacter sp. 5516J-16]
MPVSPAYVQQVKAVSGAQVWYTSRWFNAAVVACDSATLQQLQALPCVRSARTLNRGLPGTRKRGNGDQVPTTQERSTRNQYGKAFTQAQMIGAVKMHEAGFRGRACRLPCSMPGFRG